MYKLISLLLLCSILVLLIFSGITFGASQIQQQQQRQDQVVEQSETLSLFHMYKVKPKNNDQVYKLQTCTRYMGRFKPLFLQGLQSKSSTIVLLPASKVQLFNEFLVSNQIFGVYKGISTISSIELVAGPLDVEEEESFNNNNDEPMLLQEQQQQQSLSTIDKFQRHNVNGVPYHPSGSYGCTTLNYCYKYCKGSSGPWCYTRQGCGEWVKFNNTGYEMCAMEDWCGTRYECKTLASGCVKQCEE